MACGDIFLCIQEDIWEFGGWQDDGQYYARDHIKDRTLQQVRGHNIEVWFQCHDENVGDALHNYIRIIIYYETNQQIHKL